MHVATALTIAGSDSGGGAGIQADLKTFSAFGVFGMSAITAVTAQNSIGVTGVFNLPPEFVARQIDAVLSDIGADAIKIGMLADAAIVRAVAERLRAHLFPADAGGPPSVPVVLDPVMVAKGGASLLAEDAVAALAEELLPLATLVTPNLPELERLTGLQAATDEQPAAAEETAEAGIEEPAELETAGSGEEPAASGNGAQV